MVNTTLGKTKKKIEELNTTAQKEGLIKPSFNQQDKPTTEDVGVDNKKKLSGFAVSTSAADTPEKIQKRKELKFERQTFPMKEAAQPIPESTKEDLAQRGAFDEVNVTQNQLDPTTAQTGIGKVIEETPFVGPMIRALREARIGIAQNLGIPLLGADKIGVSGSELGMEIETQNIRDEALAEITRKEIKKGLSLRENVGAIIEAIPLAGKVDEWVGGRLETPAGNVATTVQTINDYRERSTNLVEKVGRGALPPDVAMEQMQMMQEDMAALEGRLRLLINTSAVLRSDSDRVNQIEEDIERARVLIEANRRAVGIQQVRFATGVGTPVPEEAVLFNELSKK